MPEEEEKPKFGEAFTGVSGKAKEEKSNLDSAGKFGEAFTGVAGKKADPDDDKFEGLPRIGGKSLEIVGADGIIAQGQDNQWVLRLENPGGGDTIGTVETAATGCKSPWTPVFSSNAGGTIFYATFVAGTINGKLATNLYSAITYSRTAPLLYATANINGAGGQIVNFSISISTTAPTGMAEAMGAPPTTFEVPLGVISYGRFTPNFCSSFSVVPEESRRVGKSPSPGEEPFDRWYVWSISPA